MRTGDRMVVTSKNNEGQYWWVKPAQWDSVRQAFKECLASGCDRMMEFVTEDGQTVCIRASDIHNISYSTTENRLNYWRNEKAAQDEQRRHRQEAGIFSDDDDGYDGSRHP